MRNIDSIKNSKGDWKLRIPFLLVQFKKPSSVNVSMDPMYLNLKLVSSDRFRMHNQMQVLERMGLASVSSNEELQYYLDDDALYQSIEFLF